MKIEIKPICTVAAIAILSLNSCSENQKITHISTTQTQSWVELDSSISSSEAGDIVEVTIDLAQKNQTIDGFGACFNELGWESLSQLTTDEKEQIINELFLPNSGANFNICRMPVAANDFALDWYSFCDTPNDFEMSTFSIDRDKERIIPFIKSALSVNPTLKLWASPWSPPAWMKCNNHYASTYNGDSSNTQYHNGLKPEDQGYEGEDMFIQEPKYLEAYALYFTKFIEAYRAEGVEISAIMPQNEFNSAQVFPSCCWRAESLANFMGSYLIPAMEKLSVETYFGTMERANSMLVDTILNDPKCKGKVGCVGFQWAGKGAIGDVHKDYPEMKLMQTEQECGDGKNDWAGVEHSWDLLKHYFDNGVSSYMYWNISLFEGGISRWGWAQNSLVVVDSVTKSYRYTPEYYLMKHISHFVKAGARHISTPVGFEGLVFENLDGSLVVLYMDKSGKDSRLNLSINGQIIDKNIAANSINTFVI